MGTFRSDYDNDYEYEFFNVYPVRMRDCVRLSRQLVLSWKSHHHNIIVSSETEPFIPLILLIVVYES